MKKKLYEVIGEQAVESTLSTAEAVSLDETAKAVEDVVIPNDPKDDPEDDTMSFFAKLAKE